MLFRSAGAHNFKVFKSVVTPKQKGWKRRSVDPNFTAVCHPLSVKTSVRTSPKKILPGYGFVNSRRTWFSEPGYLPPGISGEVSIRVSSTRAFEENDFGAIRLKSPAAATTIIAMMKTLFMTATAFNGLLSERRRKITLSVHCRLQISLNILRRTWAAVPLRQIVWHRHLYWPLILI